MNLIIKTPEQRNYPWVYSIQMEMITIVNSFLLLTMYGLSKRISLIEKFN